MPQSLLQMDGVSKRFGATRALEDVSFSVRPGRVTALIGENGAGKSTLMKILSGAYTADSGTMLLAGRPYRPAGPHHALLSGVAMIYQELNLAPDLSVEDNIMLGQEQSRFGWLRRSEQRPRVAEALRLLGHAELRPEEPVRRLSVGAQQLVEIARALVMDAKLIVFDEPTSSLTQRDVEHLFHVIRRLKQTGIGVIYISHFLEEIRAVCDDYTVLRDGRVAGSGRLEDVTEEEIVSLMVGRTVDDLFPSVPHQQGEVVLSLDGLSGERLPEDVSLQLRRGEILGVAGLVGAGRTELLRCLFALDPVRRGTVSVRVTGGWGRSAAQPSPPAPLPQGEGSGVRAAGGSLRSTPATPGERIRQGLGFVSEDRKSEGLAQDRSLADNITYSRLQPYSRFGWLRLGERRRAVEKWMRTLHIKARSAEQPVEELSGGNQQKVALARVLHQDADVLLLDEPTRGIDVGTKCEIYRLIGELAAGGKAIIFVSSYLPELLAVCDRVAVMARGRLREIRPAGEWTEESAMGVAVAGEV